jgi:hypothetical protein
MYTYQLQPRSLQIEDGLLPVFPCEVEFHFQFSPPEALGDGKSSLPVVLSETPFDATYDGNTGRVVITSSVALPRIEARASIRGGAFHLFGSHATYQYVAPSLDDLAQRLEVLRLAIPAALALYLPIPIVPANAVAKATTATLRSMLVQTAAKLAVVTEQSYRREINAALAALETVITPPATTLLVALQYLHVASRLSQVGVTPWEFAAEILLNCAKVLESLFGNKRDDIRRGTRLLGYADEEIEGVFVALSLFRNELDVAHAKAAVIPQATLVPMYEFVMLFPDAVQELTRRAISARAAGTWNPPKARSSLSSSESKQMEVLLASMKRGMRVRKARLHPDGAEPGV